MKPLCVALLLTVLSCLALAADRKQAVEPADKAVDPLEQDLKVMQGRWLREEKNTAGQVIRIEKLIDGDQDTNTHMDPNGNVIHAHSSNFKLSREGGVRVFTFNNLVVTAGPKIGTRQQKPESFLYRVNSTKLVEVWGLRDGDAEVLNVFIWRRPN